MLMLRFSLSLFQHTAARRRLDDKKEDKKDDKKVSTHSRPKAAGTEKAVKANAKQFQHTAARRRLVHKCLCCGFRFRCFNTQPPEGGWVIHVTSDNPIYSVSTHSRPKAAGPTSIRRRQKTRFQHTAARRRLAMSPKYEPPRMSVSTHSRPKAAGPKPKSN